MFFSHTQHFFITSSYTSFYKQLGTDLYVKNNSFNLNFNFGIEKKKLYQVASQLKNTRFSNLSVTIKNDFNNKSTKR